VAVVTHYGGGASLGLSTATHYPNFEVIDMRETNVERPELEPARTTRRRSWGGLLRIPLSTRSQDYLSISRSKPAGSVPTEIIREIADLLSPADILNFSLTVSFFIFFFFYFSCSFTP